jgi:hypothetical protein
MSPPEKLGFGKVPVNVHDEPRSRQPSFSDTHDDPSGEEFTTGERELFLHMLRQSEDRLIERIDDLSKRLEYVRSLIGSDRPGAVELKSPNGWRVRAKSGVAIAILMMVLATVAAWKYESVSVLFKTTQTHSGR